MKIGAAILAILLGGSGMLHAQEFYGGVVSARSAGQAGIYVPASDNVVDALAANPAGLAALNAPTLDLNLSGLLARGSFSNSSNADSPMRFNGGGVRPSGVTVIRRKWRAQVMVSRTRPRKFSVFDLQRAWRSP